MIEAYQKKGSDYLRNKKYALLGDEPGLGKTVQAILALDRYESCVLIICPKQVKQHWAKELMKWSCRKSVIIESTKDHIPTSGIIIINYDIVFRPKVIPRLKKMRFSTVICDEAHNLKNYKAKRSIAVLGKKYIKGRSERMWFLTGTPVKDRPKNIYNLISKTVPHLLSPYQGYIDYAIRFCGAYQIDGNWVDTGSSNEWDLSKRLEDFMLVRKYDDIKSNIPKVVFDTRYLKMDAQTKIIDTDIRDNSGNNIQNPLVQLGKNKVKHIIPHILGWLEEDKVVIFFKHHAVKDAIKEELGNVCCGYDGRINDKDKKKAIKDFTNDPIKTVFLGQLNACGEALDGLQFASATCVFVESQWSYSEYRQCYGRLRRKGQTKIVRVFNFIFSDSFEEIMGQVVQHKKRMTIDILPNKKEIKMFLEERIEGLEKEVQSLKKTVEALAGGTPQEVQAEIKTKVKTKVKTKEETKVKTKVKIEDLLETAKAIVSIDPALMQVIKKHNKEKFSVVRIKELPEEHFDSEKTFLDNLLSISKNKAKGEI